MTQSNIIKVTFLPYTDKKPNRIRIVDMKTNKQVVISTSDTNESKTHLIAKEYLTGKGMYITGYCLAHDNCYLLYPLFAPFLGQLINMSPQD